MNKLGNRSMISMGKCSGETIGGKCLCPTHTGLPRHANRYHGVTRYSDISPVQRVLTIFGRRPAATHATLRRQCLGLRASTIRPACQKMHPVPFEVSQAASREGEKRGYTAIGRVPL